MNRLPFVITATVLLLGTAGYAAAARLSAVPKGASSRSAATAAPSASGFECRVGYLAAGSGATGALTGIPGLEMLGTLSLAAPGKGGEGIADAGLGSLTAGGQSRYVAVRSVPADAATLAAAGTGIGSDGNAACFAKVPGTAGISLLTLSPVNEVAVAAPLSGQNFPRSRMTSFTASLPGVNPDRYTMYWQVDGDKLNPMQDDAAAGTKVTARGIDLTGWEWKARSKAYLLKFIAKDKAGATIASSSLRIWVTD